MGNISNRPPDFDKQITQDRKVLESKREKKRREDSDAERVETMFLCLVAFIVIAVTLLCRQ